MTPRHVDADAWHIVVTVATCTAFAVRPDVALGEIPGMYWICGLLLALMVYIELGGSVDDLDAPARPGRPGRILDRRATVDRRDPSIVAAHA